MNEHKITNIFIYRFEWVFVEPDVNYYVFLYERECAEGV